MPITYGRPSPVSSSTKFGVDAISRVHGQNHATIHVCRHRRPDLIQRDLGLV